MAAQLSKNPIITRDELKEIAEARLKEAVHLREHGYYGASVYLAGYSVECYLKYAICRRLDWDTLFDTFAVHDLEGLLLFSALYNKMRHDMPVYESFVKVRSLWTLGRDRSVRYRSPREFSSVDANDFLVCLIDSTSGVLPWLKKNVH